MHTFNEIKAQLKMDTDVHYLFVEGDRDLAFWRALVPITNRTNTQVIKASTVKDITSSTNGEKARLLALSEAFVEEGLSERVKFFVDADNDHLLNTTYDKCVVLSDYRDLESYCFTEECLNKFISIGLAKTQINIVELLQDIINICSPLGFLRYISESSNRNLPFQKTFDGNGRKKYMCVRTKSLKNDNLIRTLLQNARISLNDLPIVKSELLLIIDESNIDIRKVIHGKDWLFYLSMYLSLCPDSIESQLFLSLDYSSLETETSLCEIISYLKAA
jgi:hypothetical protein